MLYLECTYCMSLFTSTPLIWSSTGDLRQSEGATDEHTVFGGFGHLGFWEWDWEPASVALPRRCQSGPLLHAPLHQRADYQSGRWERGTQGNFKSALWLFLLRLKECKSLSASCLLRAMQAVLVWVIPYMHCTVHRQEACPGGLIFHSWCFTFPC